MTAPSGETGAPPSGAPARAPGNSFGLAEVLGGIAAGFLLSSVGVGLYDAATGRPSTSSSFGSEVISLLLLWVGFLGAVLLASRLHVRRESPAAGMGSSGAATTGTQSVGAATTGTQGPGAATTGTQGPGVGNAGTGSSRSDFGISVRPLRDVPLGVVVGVLSQLLLVPLLELPLRPFVPHLTQRLGHPTNQLFGGVVGGGLVLLSILVCIGSPMVEEIFFRGLLLRALLGRLGPLGKRLGPAVAIVVTGLVFAAVHFEDLQFLGLAGFGVVLGYLAYRTSRLGPSIVAHVSFNATTVIYYALHH